ncbi:MAG: Na/Pi symporter [Pseudomonadota bacterium]
MLKKILLPVIFSILAYGFWMSPDFKEISAGVAIFLFGMLALEEGFKAFTGGILERILKRTTDKLWKSISFGVVATSLMQSSSLVSVITISFLSAGLIGLAEGIGIVFGANLGTTTGAWLIAGFGLKVKISAYAMPMLVFGVILIFQKATSLKGIGYILAGLGFLFLGIHHMKEGFEAFKDTIDLAEYAVSGFLGLMLFSAIGVFATVVMQSSHATLVLIITALAAGQITYENALALAIGANVGTTITAIIGSLSANVQGKRLAGAHLIFNLTTGLITIIFIQQFMDSVDYISAQVGIANDDYALKLAVFHTIFNLVGIIVMIPFINKLVYYLTRYMHEKTPKISQPKFLYAASIDFPDTAVKSIRDETEHVYENTLEIIVHALNFKMKDLRSEDNLETIAEKQTKISPYNVDKVYNRKVKGIYSEIILFIARADFTWREEQSASLHWLRDANQSLAKSVKAVKHLQKNMNQYIISNNQYIRDEYNLMRIEIMSLLRKMEECRNHCIEDDSGTKILSLDAYKLKIEEDEKNLSKRLFEHIHKDRITPLMGTSLMNDGAYTARISRNLLEMASTLFITGSHEEAQAERALALDEDELAQVILEQNNTEELNTEESNLIDNHTDQKTDMEK